MPDRREDILLSHGSYDSTGQLFPKEHAIGAMDDYMKESVLEAFEFVAKHTTGHSIDEQGNVEFKYKGEWITSKQLFENFL